MKRIGVMSDTHGFVPRQVYDFFKDVDIIIHCGDIGSSDVLDELRLFKPVLAVYGNCDDRYAYDDVARVQYDTIEGVKIMVTHIGGYPKHYDRSIKEELQKSNCDIFFCGHSHILRVMYDEEMDFLLINPGACGRQGIHHKATLIRLCIDQGEAKDLEIMEFDKFNR